MGAERGAGAAPASTTTAAIQVDLESLRAQIEAYKVLAGPAADAKGGQIGPMPFELPEICRKMTPIQGVRSAAPCMDAGAADAKGGQIGPLPFELSAMRRKMKPIQGYHLTSESAAASIIADKTFRPSTQGMFGPFIYFATKPKDCEGKARAVHTLSEGALLKARIELGMTLYITSAHPPPAVQAFLGIANWSGLDDAKLQKACCDSVYAEAGRAGVSRDEFCVRASSQVNDLCLVDVYKSVGTQVVRVPFWEWSLWIHNLAKHVVVVLEDDDNFSDQTADPPGPVKPVVGVRTNAKGRPIHANGKFMSYAEAQRLGWKPAQQAPRPSSVHSVRRDSQSKASDGQRDDTATTKTVACVRTNAEGRPIHANGKFMSYAEAEALGWVREGLGRRDSQSKVSNRPAPEIKLSSWNQHQRSMGGQGFSRAEIRDAYYGSDSGRGGLSSSASAPQIAAPEVRRDFSSGSGSSNSYGCGGGGFTGSACYSVSSNPTGPLKADGTPDMRFKANRS